MEILLFQLMLIPAQSEIYLSFSKMAADSHLFWSSCGPSDKSLNGKPAW